MRVLTGLLVLIMLIGCSSSSNGPDDTPVFDSSYFPAGDGDTWYYTSRQGGSHVRTVDGDTVINGNTCIKILEDGITSEAWSVKETGDSAGFYVHMLSYVYGNDTIRPYFVPPLLIPFNMEVDDEYTYDSDAYYTLDGDVYTFDIGGKIVLFGFGNKTVNAGTFKDVAKVFYQTDQYYEYYAEDVGLLDNGDYVLDSAFIDGVWYK